MKRKQGGALLLFSMVMLLMATLLGVAAVDASGLQIKMTHRHKDRLLAMQGAEAGLVAAEQFIESVGFSGSELQDFDSECTGGLCFTGLGDPSSILGCTVNTLLKPLGIDQALGVFSDTNIHRSIEIDLGHSGVRAKYIIEFKCYNRGSPADLNLLDNPHQRYLITSYAETANGNGKVMLQSEYRVPN